MPIQCKSPKLFKKRQLPQPVLQHQGKHWAVPFGPNFQCVAPAMRLLKPSFCHSVAQGLATWETRDPDARILKGFFVLKGSKGVYGDFRGSRLERFLLGLGGFGGLELKVLGSF